MEIIKITPNMLFVMETDRALPIRHQEEIYKQWKELFPVNKLLICNKGSIKIFDLPE